MNLIELLEFSFSVNVLPHQKSKALLSIFFLNVSYFQVQIQIPVKKDDPDRRPSLTYEA
jgi:hypothetical protein